MTQIGPFPGKASGTVVAGAGGPAWTNPTLAWNPAAAAATVENYSDDPPSEFIGIKFGDSSGSLPLLPSSGTLITHMVITARAKENLNPPAFTLQAYAGSNPSTLLPSTVDPVRSDDPGEDGFYIYTIDITISGGQNAAILAAWNAGQLRLGVNGSDSDSHTALQDHIEINGATLESVDYTTPTQLYDRPKLAIVNNTPIALRPYVTETPAALTTGNGALTAGTTAIASLLWRADADESGGADVQDMLKTLITPTIDADGFLVFTCVVTYVKGDGTETSETFIFKHPQAVDAWQTAAGRARQA